MKTKAKRSGRIRSRQARGYTDAHYARRARLAPLVATGLVDCARCGEKIERGEAWDLGHDDVDRSKYSGPEHARCNRATASHQAKRVSRQW